MNVKELVEEYLLNNGYDGLCCDDCGCHLGDLMPCEGDIVGCQPAYKKPCNCDDRCVDEKCHMTTTKYDLCYHYCQSYEENCHVIPLLHDYDLGNKQLVTCSFFKPKENL